MIHQCLRHPHYTRRRGIKYLYCEYIYLSWCVSSQVVSNSWFHKDSHSLTDTLLTIIKENVTYKVAFGLNKGNIVSVLTGGTKVPDHLHVNCSLTLRMLNILKLMLKASRIMSRTRSHHRFELFGINYVLIHLNLV